MYRRQKSRLWISVGGAVATLLGAAVAAHAASTTKTATATGAYARIDVTFSDASGWRGLYAGVPYVGVKDTLCDAKAAYGRAYYRDVYDTRHYLTTRSTEGRGCGETVSTSSSITASGLYGDQIVRVGICAWRTDGAVACTGGVQIPV